MRLNHKRQSAGFALIAAVFLVVVVGLLITYLQRLSSNQANVNVQAVQSARALQAAQSGLEWGVYQLFNNNLAICPSSSAGAVISSILVDVNGMDLTVDCDRQDYLEANVKVILYTLTATAQQGADLTSPDYVFKRVTATIEI